MNPIPGFLVDPEQLIARERRKQALIGNLCEALKAYLCFDSEAVIEQLTSMAAAPAVSPVDIEMLMQAQKDLDALEEQKAAVEKFASGMPEDVRELLRAVQLPIFDKQIEGQKQFISHIQAELEAKANEPPEAA